MSKPAVIFRFRECALNICLCISKKIPFLLRIRNTNKKHFTPITSYASAFLQRKHCTTECIHRSPHHHPTFHNSLTLITSASDIMGSVGSSLSNRVDMASPAAQFVTSQIQSNKIVIFSKSSCPYCRMAKDQFKKLNAPMHVIELEKRSDGNEIQDVLGQLTGGRTVPRCFVNGKFIGGGTDVKELYENGKLQEMVA